jgi:hypothetical protein
MRDRRALRPAITQGKETLIPLGGTNGVGKWAVVDTADAPKIAALSWSLGPFGVRAATPTGNVLLHRLIMGAPRGMVVDHRDHDILNNRRNNLRLCRQSKNCQNNIGVRAHEMHRLRGVFRKTETSWIAYIRHMRERIHLGHFPTKQSAWNARRAAEIRLRGEFAPPLPDRLEEKLQIVPPLTPGAVRNALLKSERHRAYRLKHREELMAASRAYYHAHSERLNERRSEKKREAKLKGLTP